MTKGNNCSVTKEQVEKIADISHLSLTNQEAESLTEELSSTVEYIDTLAEINTENTVPTFRTNRLENVFRDDEIKPSFTQASALANAKRTHQGYFIAKSVFK